MGTEHTRQEFIDLVNRAEMKMNSVFTFGGVDEFKYETFEKMVELLNELRELSKDMPKSVVS